ANFGGLSLLSACNNLAPCRQIGNAQVRRRNHPSLERLAHFLQLWGMPLYFFHVFAVRGQFYADTTAAQRHAVLLAKRPAKDGYSGGRIVVTDAHGSHTSANRRRQARSVEERLPIVDQIKASQA